MNREIAKTDDPFKPKCGCRYLYMQMDRFFSRTYVYDTHKCPTHRGRF